MTPAAIIQEAMADGVTLVLSPAGTIKATGKQAAVDRWLPVIREHKPAILAALARHDETEDLREAFEERAGILEHDAGLPRPEAELEAARITGDPRPEPPLPVGIAADGARVVPRPVGTARRSLNLAASEVQPIVAARIFRQIIDG